MKELIKKETAKNVLDKYLPIMNTIMIDSLNSLKTAINVTDEKVNNRAKATFFHAVAVEKAKKLFSDSPDIKLIEKYQSIQIVFDKLMVGRIKKLDKNNLTSNSKSSRNSAIISQQLQMFDLPQITYIDLGYSNDPIWNAFDKLIVVCRLNDNIKWELPFDADSIQITLKTEPIDVKPIETETKITIKKRK